LKENQTSNPDNLNFPINIQNPNMDATDQDIAMMYKNVTAEIRDTYSPHYNLYQVKISPLKDMNYLENYGTREIELL